MYLFCIYTLYQRFYKSYDSMLAVDPLEKHRVNIACYVPTAFLLIYGWSYRSTYRNVLRQEIIYMIIYA